VSFIGFYSGASLAALPDTDEKLLSWRGPVLSAARVRENWFGGLTEHGAILPERDHGCQRPITDRWHECWRTRNPVATSQIPA